MCYFISFDQEIDRAIVGSIVRSGVLSLSRLGDHESDWEFDQETVTDTGLVRLVSSWFVLWILFRSGDCLGDQEFYWEIGRLIYRGFS